MKIGLIDVDNQGKIAKFPNLALMKISAYHKRLGHQVEWANYIEYYDKVYTSKVFSFTDEVIYNINANEIVRGGVGRDLKNKLPSEIEHIYPDYSLYNIKDRAYGFLTKGCFRNCQFCNVTEQQGFESKQVADLSEFWSGEKEIILLDPNILACRDWRKLFKQLIDSRAYIEFSQGLDIRLMTKEKARMILQMKIRRIHFSWDHMADRETIVKKLRMFKDTTKLDKRKLAVYTSTNFDSTHQEDLERVEILKEIGCDPYIMIYDKYNAPRETRLLQRWVNNKIVFRSCDRFEDFDSTVA